MEIFKLFGSIMVDSAAAEDSLHKTDSKAEGVANSLSKGIATAAKWGTAIVAGATAAVTGVAKLATNTAAAADEVDKMSQKLGMSKEAYQEWDYVLSQAGVDITSMSTGVKTLTNKLDDAKNGGEEATAMFEKLGLSAEDLDSLSREDVFSAVITGMQGMEDSTERAALANDLFGKSGQELTALFNETAESTQELKDKAHELGLIMSDETIDAGVSLTDTLDTMKRSFSAVTAQLGSAVMPIVEEVCSLIISYMPQINSFISRLVPIVTQLFTKLVPPLLDLAEQLLPVIFDLIEAVMPTIITLVSNLLPVIVQLLNQILPPFVQIVSTLLPPLLELLQPVLDLLGPILELLNPILALIIALVQPIANLISSSITPLIRIITTLIGGALEPLKKAFSTVSSFISQIFAGAVANIKTGIDTIRSVFTGVISFIKNVFTGNWRDAWNNVKSIFSSIASGLGAIFKSPINTIIRGINTFIGGLNKIKIPDWVPGVGGRGFSISSIPYLAEGGVLEKGQTGFLEGNGAEAVVPLENNRKWIKAVAEDMETTIGGGKSADLLQAILDKLDSLQTDIYLDGDTLVSKTADRMNRQLGRIKLREGRTMA